MGNITKAANHLSVEDLKAKIKKTTGFWRVQRWLVVYNAFIDPRPAKDIAKHTGLAVGTVHNIISGYNKHGPSFIETVGKGGRRRSYIKLKEEGNFLESFRVKAASGELVTIKEIKDKYESKVGKRVNKTTIYRLLNRHGWRKLIPRPHHVGGNKEAQETFKKTLGRM